VGRNLFMKNTDWSTIERNTKKKKPGVEQKKIYSNIGAISKHSLKKKINFEIIFLEK
jgi:hypothetical protein